MKRQFFECSCYGEGILLSSDEPTDKDPNKLIYLSMWGYGGGFERDTWWNRLRWCWQVLTKGEPFDDEVALTLKEASRFCSGLRKRIALLKK